MGKGTLLVSAAHGPPSTVPTPREVVVTTPKGLKLSSRGQGHAFPARRPRMASPLIVPTPKELVGAPVDFVLRSSLEKSPNRFARDHILSTAVCVYGS